MTSLTGSRDEPQNGRTAEQPKPTDVPPTAARSGAARPERSRSAQDLSDAARTRRRTDSRHAAEGGPSWILRGAAVLLLALLMIALLVIVFSLL